MLATVIVLSITCVFLVASLLLAVKKCLKLNDQLTETYAQVEESLDVLDGCYARITRTSKYPVISNEPIVAQVVLDIKNSRAAILAVANKIVASSSHQE